MRNRNVVWALIFASVGCQGPGWALSEDHSAELEERRTERERRMNIRVQRLDADGDPVGDPLEVSPVLVAGAFEKECRAQLGLGGGQFTDNPSPSCGGPDSCRNEVCEAQLALCIAHRLMEVASAPFPVPFEVTILDLAGGVQSFPVQTIPTSAEAQAALYELGFGQSSRATLIAGENLRSLAGIPPSHPDGGGTPGCTDPDEAARERYAGPGRAPDPPSLAEALALTLVEGTQVAQEAAVMAAERFADVADAEFARSTDVAVAAELAWVDGTMSRARGAHLLIGGDRESALFGYTGEGVCPEPELSDEVREAVDVIRESGADPRLVFDPAVGFERLLAGGHGSSSGESIGERLAERRGDPRLAAMGAGELLIELGITRTAFDAARRHLAHEAKAFGRVLDAVRPPEAIDFDEDPMTSEPIVRTTTAPTYAAVADEPMQPPHTYYNAITIFSSPWLHADELDDRPSGFSSGTAPVPVSTEYAEKSAAGLSDYATSIAHDLTPVSPDHPSFPGWLPDGALDILGRFATDSRGSRPGRLETCYGYRGDDVDRFRFRIYGYNQPAEFSVVAGLAGLRCAILGHVEGTACDLTDHVVEPTVRTGAELPAGERTVGFSSYVELQVELDFSVSQPDWLFVVRRVAARGEAPPGGHEGVGYLRTERMTATSGDWNYCSLQPIVPELDRLAADLVTPSTESCSRPARSCAGIGDGPIPLENELIRGGTEGDSVENSWRHYLDVAMQAATHADMLGEALIQQGFEIDDRIETSEAELEGVCGGALSIRELAWGTLDEARAGECASADACPAGYACENGRCVRDLDATIDVLEATDEDAAERLRRCLGDDQIVPLAALGSRDVCVWRRRGANAGDPVCGVPEGATGPISKTCPFLAEPSELEPERRPACERPEGLPSDYEVIRITDRLQLFETRAAVPDDVLLEASGDAANCDLIRRIRRGDGNATEHRDALIESEFFDPDRLQQIAQRVGWRGYPGDHSAITVDRADKWHTGYPLVRGPAPVIEGWPCDHPALVAMSESERTAFLEAVAAGTEPACTRTEMDLGASLFESYTCHCAADVDELANAPGRMDRARMNLRMARAVLALKLAAGAGLSGFEGPYLPRLASLVWEADGDAEACAVATRTYCVNPDERCSAPSGLDTCDFEKYEWRLDTMGDDWFGGRTIQRGNSLVYWVEESDGGDDKKTLPPLQGRAYCSDDYDIIWTLLDDYGDAAPQWIQTGCDRHNNIKTDWATSLGHRAPLLFRDYDISFHPTGGDAPARRTWNGLVPHTTAGDPTIDPLDGAMYHALRNPTTLDEVRIAPEDGLTTYWRSCHRLNRCRSLEPDSMEQYNLAKVAETGLTTRDLLDAVELACEVAAEEHGTCRDAMAIQPRSWADIGLARKQLECIADTIILQSELTVVRNAPRQLLPDDRSPEAFEGERGHELANIITAYQRLNDHQRHIYEEIEDFSSDLEALQRTLRGVGIQRQLARLERTSAVWSHTTNCISAVASAVGQTAAAAGPMALTGVVGIASGASAASTCANSVAQISLAYERLDLQEELADLEAETSWAEFSRRFRDHHRQLKDLARLIEDEIVLIQGATGALEAHRQSARRHLGRGMMLRGDITGRYFATNAVMRARYNTLRIRYQEAHRYAIRMAALARRALEQRIGMPLSSIHEDLAFVDAPARWADAVCTMQGIDYQAIAGPDSVITSYEGEYVGDYVRRLEQVFESYSIDFNFSDGPDTAVVSVRDDVALSRAPCVQRVNNLLASSADLEATDWAVVGCTGLPPEPPICSDTVTVDCSEDRPITRYCAIVGTIGGADPADLPLPFFRQELGPVVGYRVTFGPAGADSSFRPNTATEIDPTALIQRVTLPPGTYRLSWRGRDTTDAATMVTHDADSAVAVRTVETVILLDGSTVEIFGSVDEVRPAPLTGFGWPLHYSVFELTQPENLIEIAVLPKLDETARHAIDVGAFMLEDVSGEDVLTLARLGEHDAVPVGYAATREPGFALELACEDTLGTYFRRGWTYDCTRLCATGFGSCADGEPRCFWERRVSIGLDDLERGTVLSRAGFALGNYNYRVAGLGVNFVGVNVRDCADSGFGSTCFSSGNVPYSVYHHGKYRVRNHRGEVYDAPLFTGNIESARGLAAERYLTNPLSSADRALIEPYIRHELDGRPLTGDFVIRIWDDGRVRFDAIEDVQVVLQYRYWTRND